MKCPNCNNEIPDNSKFCVSCGSKVELKTVADLTLDASPITPSAPTFGQNDPSQTGNPTSASADAGAPPIPPTPPVSQGFGQPQQPQPPHQSQYVTNPKPPKTCKTCGGKIDPFTKRCENCGKPYSSVNGMLIGMIAAGVVALILAAVLVVQSGKLNNAYATIDDQENTIATLQSEMVTYQEKSDFLDENIVFVVDGDDVYYHTYECSAFETASSYYAMNTNLAIYYGYIADPYCN